MTLIISARWRGGTIQTVDRLVTQAVNGHPQTFDAASNKTVVVGTRDGIASISYTGLSFIGSLHTDLWISSIAFGRPIHVGPLNRPVTSVNGSNRGPGTLGELFNALAAELTTAFASTVPDIDRGAVLELVSIGWRTYCRKSKRAQPFYCRISRSANPAMNQFVVSYARREIGDELELAIDPAANAGFILDPFPSAELARDIRGLEDHFVGNVREAARATAAIGQDALTVTIAPPSIGRAFIRSHPLAPTRLGFNSLLGSSALDLGYAPCIVARDFAMPAFAFSSSMGMTLEVGSWQVVFPMTTDPPPGSLRSTQISPAPRKPSPRR